MKKINLKKVTLLLFLLNIVLLVDCTGFNIASGVYRVTANTHPAPDYAGGYGLMRGGLIYYKDVVDGQIGENASPKQVGKSCSHAILALISTGDSSIETAKRNGKIKKVAHLSHEITAILSGRIYHEHCTIVSGE
jgi:hypothetical protein